MGIVILGMFLAWVLAFVILSCFVTLTINLETMTGKSLAPCKPGRKLVRDKWVYCPRFFHHLVLGVDVFLGHIGPECHRVMSGHAFRRLAKIALLLLEKFMP